MKKRKDGRYCRKVTLNDSTTKYFYSSASTERMAERDINRQVLNYEEGEHKKRYNFLKLAEAAIEEREDYISNATYEGYNYALKHLEAFYDKDIISISPAMVQKLLDDMSRKQYSYSAISKTKIVFGLTLDYAIVNKNIPLTNFMRSIKIPRHVKKGKVSSPDDKIIKAVTENAEKASFGMWAMIELCTGMRRGELNALQRHNINFKKNEIYITQATEFIGNRAHLKDCPKTESGIRSVPILDILREPLKDMCKNMKAEQFVFGGEEPCSLCAIQKRWGKYCKEIGYTFNQHQLRHAYAKLLYSAGIDPKTMQQLLGHANFNTTMNIYTDFANEVTQKSISKLNKYMAKKF